MSSLISIHQHKKIGLYLQENFYSAPSTYGLLDHFDCCNESFLNFVSNGCIFFSFRGLETTPFAQEARLKLESVSLNNRIFLSRWLTLSSHLLPF